MWRLANATDDNQITAMSLELFLEDPGVRPVPEEHTRRTLLELRKNPVRGKALVLELDSKAVGYAFLMSFWSNEMGGEVCYIDELFVKKEARAKGHSTRLIESLSSRRGEYWSQNMVAIDLEVTPNNQRARELYSRLGFSPWKNSMMRLRF